MAYRRQPENIKTCPECGTNLINTAKRCAVCGTGFAIDELEPTVQGQGSGHSPRRNPFAVTISLPALLGGVLLIVAVNALVIVGLQRRDETKLLIAGAQATATYMATTYISPTPEPTMTNTPGPPTRTPAVSVEYVVVEGDSCISIADRFDIYVDDLLRKNDIDCAQLQLGTVLEIPPPVATAVPISTDVPVDPSMP